MYCPRCRSEYREEKTSCPVCNVPLVETDPGQMTAEQAEHTAELARESAGDGARIAHIRSRLDEAGIPFSVRGATHQMGLTLGDVGNVRFFVRESDLASARDHLLGAETEAGELPESEEMRNLRLKRRFRITRWMIWPVAVMNLVFGASGMIGSESFWLGEFAALIGAGYIALLQWSKKEPKKAFCGLFLLASANIFAGILIRMPILIFAPNLIPFLALYFAYDASMKAERRSSAARVTDRAKS